MSTIEERTAYLDNPYFKGHIYGNFNPFYVTIAICTVFGVLVIALNVICCCCSKYKPYWQDRNTDPGSNSIKAIAVRPLGRCMKGNLWLVSLWSSTPHKQPPLDLTELKDASYFQPVNPDVERPVEYTVSHHRPQYHHHQQQPRGSTPQQGFHREEYVELQQKRESDI